MGDTALDLSLIFQSIGVAKLLRALRAAAFKETNSAQ